MDRRSAIWQVCDELAAENIKPTRQTVSARYPRGSAGDVQKDINDWYAQLFQRHTTVKQIPGIPDEVVASWQDAWEQSVERASKEFDGERESFGRDMRVLEERLRETDEALSVSEAANEQLEDRLQQLEDRLQQLDAELATGKQALLDRTHEVELLRTEKAALNKERELALSQLSQVEARQTAELASLSERHKEEIRQLEQAHHQNLTALTHGHDTLVVTLKSQITDLTATRNADVSRMDEQYRLLQTDSLAHLDRVRQELREAESQRREESQKHVAYERKIAELEASVQMLKDRLAERESEQAQQLAGKLSEFEGAIKTALAGVAQSPKDDTL